MRALSIRQPYAELILRGEKTIEYRSRPTRIIGERFYIYAARKWAGIPLIPENGHNADDLTPGDVPTGVIVGSAVIDHCAVVRASCLNGNGAQAGSLCHQHYQWHLRDVKRLKRPRKPKGMPQPMWFYPF